jgi:hypothetical protein
MGSKGLWRHVEGTAVTPVPYALVNGIPVLPDGKTQATEEQIKTKEFRIMDFDKHEYLAQHIILSTTSMCLGAKIKDLKMAKEMWDVVKADATTKSTLTRRGVLKFKRESSSATSTKIKYICNEQLVQTREGIIYAKRSYM